MTVLFQLRKTIFLNSSVASIVSAEGFNLEKKKKIFLFFI